MKPGYGLELIQTQRLVLTPELRQAIAILQMNALELRDYLKEEVEKNPLLEIGEGADEEPIEGYEEELSPNIQEKTPDDRDSQDTDEPDGQERDVAEEEWLDYLGSIVDSTTSERLYVQRPQDLPPIYENTALKRMNLKEYLLSQIGLLDLTPIEEALAEYIVGSIDDNGYLRSSVAEIALATGQSKEDVKKMIDCVQNLEPKGVGARDLRECLLLQARDGSVSELALSIIDANLIDLGRGRYKKIANERKVTVKEVLKARDEILGLDPKPGSQFSSETVPYVIPDIIIRKVGQDLLVSLNDGAFPIIRWNSFYQRLMNEMDGPAKSYLVSEYHKAKTLLKNIERRKSTISKVMGCILQRQKGFFLKGPMYLEPLSLKDVAGEIGVHESTVSRAVSNKFVDTPFGVFSCKVFFNTGINSQKGSVSQYSVKEYVKDMVKNENPQEPLSDEEISTALKEKGIKVERRTVAKYRQELGIPSSSRRRRL